MVRHRSDYRKVPGSILGVATLMLLLNKKLYSHCSSLPSCFNGDLVTWCKLGKQISTCCLCLTDG